MDQNDTVTEKLDGLVREDMALGKEIARLTRSRDIRVRLVAQRMREEAEPFERELAPLQKKRDAVREQILEIWAKHHDRETSVDVPCAKVSRRNYRELAVHDTEALVDALDRTDRLDLVGYVFDDKAVARLIAKGKLSGLPEGAAEIIDHYNLQVWPQEETKRA